MIQRIRSYRDLAVWQRAMDVAADVLALTRTLPWGLQKSLGDQMGRSATSVAANVAEGHGRRYRKEYIHHVSIANGSLKELETHLLLLRRHDARFIERVDGILRNTEEIGRMLTALYRALSRSSRKDP